MTYWQPFFPLLLVLTVAGVLFWKNRTRVLRVCALALFLFCWPPTAKVPLRFFESRYSVEPPSNDGIQAIVVLASEVLPPTALRATAIPAFDTYQRCEHAAWLYGRGLHVPVLASGKGNAGNVPYAVTMRSVLQQQGIPETMIWTEEHSTSTYESARDSAEILRQRGVTKIALVTEAFHMLRAELCFRKQGLTVVPAACCFRTDPDDFAGWTPSAKTIAWNEDTMHEILGLVWYRIQGRI